MASIQDLADESVLNVCIDVFVREVMGWTNQTIQPPKFAKTTEGEIFHGALQQLSNNIKTYAPGFNNDWSNLKLADLDDEPRCSRIKARWEICENAKFGVPKGAWSKFREDLIEAALKQGRLSQDSRKAISGVNDALQSSLSACGGSIQNRHSSKEVIPIELLLATGDDNWRSLVFPTESAEGLKMLEKRCLRDPLHGGSKLDPTQFRTDDHPQKLRILDEIQKVLFPDMKRADITAEIYALDVRSTFESPKECVKLADTRDIIGWLHICLPSKFEGGKMTIDKMMEYKWAPNSGAALQWAAYRNDQCETEPVTNGYRITLVYILRRNNPDRLANPGLDLKAFPIYRQIKKTIEMPGFMKDGGILGILCNNAYPHTAHEDTHEVAASRLVSSLRGLDKVIYSIFLDLGLDVGIHPVMLSDKGRVFSEVYSYDKFIKCLQTSYANTVRTGAQHHNILEQAVREEGVLMLEQRSREPEVPQEISVIWVGNELHPYGVYPLGTGGEEEACTIDYKALWDTRLTSGRKQTIRRAWPFTKLHVEILGHPKHPKEAFINCESDGGYGIFKSAPMIMVKVPPLSERRVSSNGPALKKPRYE